MKTEVKNTFYFFFAFESFYLEITNFTNRLPTQKI